MNKQIEEIKRKALPVLKKYPIKRAGVFGSYTRGEQKEDSDIDILVELEKNPKLKYFEFLGIEGDLKDSIGKEVDLVEYSRIRPELQEYILPNEVRIYEKDS